MDASWREPIPEEALRAIAEASQRGPNWLYVAGDAVHAALVRAALRSHAGFGSRPFWDEPVTDVLRLAGRVALRRGLGVAMSRPAELALSAICADRAGLRRDEASRWVLLWGNARLANPGLASSDDLRGALPPAVHGFLRAYDAARRRARLFDRADLHAILADEAARWRASRRAVFLDLVDPRLAMWRGPLAREPRGDLSLTEVTRPETSGVQEPHWTLFEDTVAEARSVASWAAERVASGKRVAVLVPNATVAGRVVEALRDEAVHFSSALGVPLSEFPVSGQVRETLARPEWAAGGERRRAEDHAVKLLDDLESAGFTLDLANATVASATPEGMFAVAAVQEIMASAVRGISAAEVRPPSASLFAAVVRHLLDAHHTRPRFDATAPVLVDSADRTCPLPVDAVAIVGVCRTYFGHAKESAEVCAFRKRWGLSEAPTALARVLSVVNRAAAIAGDDVWISGAERHGDERLSPIREWLARARRGLAPPSKIGPCALDRHVAEENVAVERARHRAWAPSPFDGVLSPTVAAIVRARLGLDTREISASQLDEYVVCPFRYFARRVLGIKDPAPAGGDIAANDVGTFVHELLAAFYAGLSPEMRAAKRDAAWCERARAGLVELALVRLAATPWPATYAARVRHELLGNPCEPGLVQRFIEEEARQKTRPLFIEARFGSTTHGVDVLSAAPLLVQDDRGFVADGQEAVSVRIRGAIDRVDVAPDGRSLVLYDYKTGPVKPPAAPILAGTSFQLPIYLLALARAYPDRPVVFGGLYALHDARRGESFGPRDKFQLRHPERALEAGLGRGYKSNGRRDDFDDVLETVRRAIGAHVESIRAGRFPVGALDAATMGCSGCAFQLACRTDPVRALDVVARRPAEFPLPIAHEAIDELYETSE
ncbi:MAG: PD-(D/E)XK nuclease family protein [Deltaproteobacteria bacterium]|nr:PD-(D/E)XK nuclease family protein [Deltaproteobacteria bacterium]